MAIYTTGLQSAGSYQASGRPFIARRTVSKDGQVKIEFPSVTKSITIRIPSISNAAARMEKVASSDYFWFTTQEVLNSSPQLPVFGSSSAGAIQDWTIALWYKADSSGGNNKRLVNLFGTTSSPLGRRGTISNTSNTQLTFELFDNSSISLGTITKTGIASVADWNHILLTQKTGSTHMYVNGVAGSSTVSQIGQAQDIRIGWNGGNNQPLTASVDEMTFWYDGMDANEVAELYNNGEWFNPRTHTKNSDIKCWWTFGDHHLDVLGSPATTGTVKLDIIYDVIDDTEENLNLTRYLDAVDQNYATTTGPFTNDSIGKLRMHLLSTGSASGANIYANKHYYELGGYNSSIKLPMKTKEIYLSAVDAAVTFEIIAELTHIAPERMYALTGSGIDE